MGLGVQGQGTEDVGRRLPRPKLNSNFSNEDRKKPSKVRKNGGTKGRGWKLGRLGNAVYSQSRRVDESGLKVIRGDERVDQNFPEKYTGARVAGKPAFA